MHAKFPLSFFFVVTIMFPFSAQAEFLKPKWCSVNPLQSVEATICGDPTLAASERLIENLYKEVMSFRGREGHEGHWPGEVISNQRDWLEKRHRLVTKKLLLDGYITRIQELSTALQVRWQ